MEDPYHIDRVKVLWNPLKQTVVASDLLYTQITREFRGLHVTSNLSVIHPTRRICEEPRMDVDTDPKPHVQIFHAVLQGHWTGNVCPQCPSYAQGLHKSFLSWPPKEDLLVVGPHPWDKGVAQEPGDSLGESRRTKWRGERSRGLPVFSIWNARWN